MRTVFIGTPNFSIPSLQALMKREEIILVITQKDKPKGRGYKISPSSVKEFSTAAHLPIYDEDLNNDAIEKLRSLQPDLIIVVAFGKIISKEILNIPKYGCINLHPSLLPKYRGAAPINWAIIRGEKKTGVTTIWMNEKMDAGDIILQKEVEIENEDTYGTLSEKLSIIGTEVLLESIELIKSGNAPHIPQDESKVSFAPIITKEFEKISWQKSAKDIFNLIRGLNPYPGAFTYYKEKIWKIWKTKEIVGEKEEVGKILSIGKESFKVCCGENYLEILELQEQGGKKLSSKDFLTGHRIQVGEKLG